MLVLQPVATFALLPCPYAQLTFISAFVPSSCRQMVVYRAPEPEPVGKAALHEELAAYLESKRVAAVEREALKKIRADALKLFLKTWKKNWTILRTQDKHAILDYTGPGYGVLNKALRTGVFDESLHRRVRDVKKALNKLSLKRKPFQGRVYRGVKELPQDVVISLIPGATFCDKAFLSTSCEEEQAYSKDDGCFLFVIESKSGMDVSKDSKFKKEAEILFRPSTLFRITQVEKDVETDRAKGVTRVWMEEMY